MALSDVEIRNAKPVKLADGRGLHLVITPAGGKLSRLKYRVAGKEKLLSLGAYPAVTLAAARKVADKVRDDLRAGIDPGQAMRSFAKGRLAGSALGKCVRFG